MILLSVCIPMGNFFIVTELVRMMNELDLGLIAVKIMKLVWYTKERVL